MPGQSRPGQDAERDDARSITGPGRYPDGREYPTRPRIVNPELAELASDGSQIDGEPTETITRVDVPDLWLETVLLSWDSRYPIHQEA